MDIDAVPFIGLLVQGIRKSWRWLMWPRINFLPPVQRRSSNGTVWWHLPVEVWRAPLLLKTIKDCQPRLIRHWKWKDDPPPGEGIHMRWLSPTEEISAQKDLRPNYIYHIPIAMRDENDTKHDAIITGSAFFSDQDEDTYKFERSERSEFKMVLLSGKRRFQGPTYTLFVPKRNESNGHFWLQLWRPDLQPE